MTDADRIAAIVRKAEANCCNVTIDEIRWLADRAARPLTVGAALALPEVQSGACVVEYQSMTLDWSQVNHGSRSRAWCPTEWAVANAGVWYPWRPWMTTVASMALPCRLVPLAEADANPATRGEMP